MGEVEKRKVTPCLCNGNHQPLPKFELLISFVFLPYPCESLSFFVTSWEVGCNWLNVNLRLLRRNLISAGEQFEPEMQ